MKLLGCNRRNLSVRAERRLGGLVLTLGFQSGPDLLFRPMWEPGCVFIKAQGAPRFGVSCRTTDESCVCCCIREALSSTQTPADWKHCACERSCNRWPPKTHFLIPQSAASQHPESPSVMHPVTLWKVLIANVCLRYPIAISILPLGFVCARGPPVRPNGTLTEMCCDKTRPMKPGECCWVVK